MVFYFSGTGNSYYIAGKLAERLGDRLVPIAREMDRRQNEYRYEINAGEAVGFVFPVYAWMPPKIVTDFIDRLRFSGSGKKYIFAAAVCGDDAGNAIDVLAKHLRNSGLQLDCCFSVIMPNNYVVLFDVDSKETEKNKLEAAEKTIDRIAEAVSGRKSGIFEVRKGAFPGLKTKLIGTMFNKYGTGTGDFFANEKCTGCRICEKICSLGNITVKGKPEWGSSCAKCLACLHYCPVRAIQHGKGTVKKGRYVNPNVKMEEMFLRQ